jgi:3-deoxy-manno-octulosonate cytidylyltransferase (CMP-KDO synthetase)
LWGITELKIGIIIPARLESKRLPNKVVKPILGKPMIEHVWRRSQLVSPNIETVIATDSVEIATLCKTFDAKTLITSSNHINGLSRVGEASKTLNWDFYIVLQADEILVEPKNLNKLIGAIKVTKKQQFLNLITNLTHYSELSDKNIVKCLVREDNSIINIFRKSGSVASGKKQLNFTKKICGIFAISKEALETIVKAPAQIIEVSESIEQMKAIELGFEILGVEIDQNYPSVNTEEESVAVLKILKTDQKQKTIFSLLQ